MLIQFLALFVAGVLGQSCTAPYIRKEFRQLSPTEKSSLFNAITKLKGRAKGPSDPAQMAQWNHDQFTSLHWEYQNDAHFKDVFFPWHRYMIYGYEMALRSIDPSVILPYWDWTLDYSNPFDSEVLSPANFGGNGDSSTHCVNTGIVAGWQTTVPSNRPAPACLRRCFEWKRLASPTEMAKLLSQFSKYTNFRNAIENGPHAAFHSQGGSQSRCGDIGNMYSPNDPLFFLHHAMVDKIWWRWQNSCPGFVNAYDETVSAAITPYKVSVEDVLAVNGSTFCYTYSSSTGDEPLTPSCPSPNSPNSETEGNQTNSTPSMAAPDWFQNAIADLVVFSDGVHLGPVVGNATVGSPQSNQDPKAGATAKSPQLKNSLLEHTPSSRVPLKGNANQDTTLST